MNSSLPLKEYRCSCGKLLFRSILVASVVEIKCKRCSVVRTFGESQNAQTISFKSLEDIVLLIRDAPENARRSGYLILADIDTSPRAPAKKAL